MRSDKVKKIVNETLQNLSKLDSDTILDNPHVAQCIFSGTPRQPADNLKFTRIVENMTRIPYYNRISEINTNLHKGQHKLLLSEIEFLTKYGDVSIHILYIGAAPGYHIPCLGKLFPKHIFYLYDPAFLHINHLRDLIMQKRAFIYPKYFTEKTCSEFKKMHLSNDSSPFLLISDIRTSIAKKSIKEMDQVILENMELQKKIVKCSNPTVSMLKFRLPWIDTDFEYFDGVRYFGVYAKWESTETRLIVTDINSTKMYNGKQNEEEMFYFNTVQRPAIYKHVTIKDDRFDGCYDCTAELSILQEYLDNLHADYVRCSHFADYVRCSHFADYVRCSRSQSGLTTLLHALR